MNKRNTRTGANAAVQVAKSLRGSISHEPTRLASGYWAIVSPVSAPLIDEAAARIKEPEVPIVFIEDKGRSEPNPNDPEYLKALERLDTERALASVEAIIMMGVDIVNEDGSEFEYNKEDKWFTKVSYLAKRNRISLDEYDLDDPFDLEFVFKKYVAVSAADIAMITAISGLNAEEIDQAVKTFRSD